MKLSDFAACYGVSSSSKEKTVVPTDEPDPTRRSPARPVVLSSSSGSTPTRPWRQPLDAISENASALLPAAKKEAIRKGNKVNCSGETRSAGQVKVVPRRTNRPVTHDSSYSDRKTKSSSSIIMAIPSFYPSPVMF